MTTPTLVGRDAELAAARTMLLGEGVVSVFGPPGVGKSRFAEALARSAGVRTVTIDARRLTARDALRRELAAALGVAWDGRDPHELFRAVARVAPVLVIVDGADAIASSIADEIASWFVEAAELSIVTTSMQRLNTPFDFELRPLDGETARELFVRCASAVQPGYAPAALELEAIDELVRILDGLPLAIELAASRRGVLSPRDILDRIADRFVLLRGPAGPQLRAAVEWAWELLDPDLQRHLCAFAVFEAPFDLQMATGVSGLDTIACVEALQALCDRSLVRGVPEASVAGESRFELYATVRGYVREVGVDLPWRRHAEIFVRAAGAWLDELDRGEGARLGAVTAAVAELGAILERGVCEAALVLDRVFERTGTDVAREHALELALAAQPAAAVRADLLVARAMTRIGAGAFVDARADLQSALDAAREAADSRREARVLFRSGDVARRTGDAADAMFLLAQSLELADGAPELGRLALAHLGCCYVDQQMMERARETVTALERMPPAPSAVAECEVRRRLAYVHFYLGNHAEQHRQGIEALECAVRAHHRRLQALCTQGLGDSATYLGQLDEARAAYEGALEIHRQLGDAHYEGVLLGNLGTVHHRSDRLEDAADCYRRALAVHRRTGARPYEAVVAASLGMLEVERGRVDEARHHLAVAIDISTGLGLHDDVGAAELALGWAAERAGEHEAARARFAAAQEAFDRADAAAWAGIAGCLAGRRQFAEVRDLVERSGSSTERALLAQVERFLGDATPEDVPTHSLHVRLARSAVDAAQTDGATVPRGAVAADAVVVVRVASDGSWFEAGAGRVDLKRRRAHRLILLELARRRAGGEGSLDVYQAFDVGWPNEIAGAESAADRVYWVVGTLRRLGLRDMLETVDAGYQLAPAVVIEPVD